MGCGGDDFPVVSIKDMGVQPESREAFPLPVLWIPEVFEPGVAGFGNGTPFTEAVDS